eukprot:comp22189_c0_seq1/m.32604 comp22189_c0_seq1/g.32604  ORF comp22189_c0_seq1/g.32604 comp22189_c0_seq1/m.32604 type:complete len:441 (-) comp22189_c0_seq1:436-1758(-)
MSAEQSTQGPIRTFIEATQLIPGTGEPIPNGVVVLEGKKILYAGAAAGAPAKNERDVTVKGDTVMPGMWDCHAHFIGLPMKLRPGWSLTDYLIKDSPEVALGRSTKEAEKTLDAGFTSAREMGGPGHLLRQLIDEGVCRGPNIYFAGASLSQTAGHGDGHDYGLDLLCTHGNPYLSILADGEDEVRKAVRKNFRIGAHVIKVHASGGVLSELDNPFHQQYTNKELECIVDEAARMERIVGAHCHGKAGIMAAINAGVKTIEHGTYVDDECAKLMVEKGVILVMTRRIMISQFGAYIEKGQRNHNITDASWEKAIKVYSEATANHQTAIRHGVKIACGTDVGFSVDFGTQGLELMHMVDLGMTPLKAIEAATANGPLTLGPQAPLSGQLKEGYDADVLLVAGNPLADIKVLGDPNNVQVVWKGGVVQKDLIGALKALKETL